MRVIIFLAAAISAALVVNVKAQATAPPSPANAAPSVPVPGGIELRSLPAVLDVRERRQDWHEAAQQAAARITEESLRTQFNQRISGLVPKIAAALTARPQEQAVVSVAVFANAEAKQSMLAVTFEGLGSQISESFFADVADGKLTPPQAQGIPASLALDTKATSYLVFFVDHRKLDAGDISQDVMARSIALASSRQQHIPTRGPVGGAAASPAQQSPPVPPQPDAQQAAAYQAGGLGYYPQVNDGYYYPAIGVPIVIVPGEDASLPDVRARQRRREEDLEHQHQNRRGNNSSIMDHSVSPTTQSAATPTGAGNVAAQGPLTAKQPPNTAHQPLNAATQPSNTAKQPPNTAKQPPNTANQPPNTAKQPPNTAKQPPNTPTPPANTAKQPPNTAKQPPNTASPPPAPPAGNGQNSSPPPAAPPATGK